MQEDHSMWMESLLFHTLPKPVGTFLEDYSMPLIGEQPALPTSLSSCVPTQGGLLCCEA